MSLLHLFRMSAAGSRGELRLINKDEHDSFGHFLLESADKTGPALPPLRLYFSYEVNPSPADMARDHFHASVVAELITFFNALKRIQPMSPYVLKSVEIPFSFPIPSDRWALSKM